MSEIADQDRDYTTELSKGQGAISETLTLLEYWEPGVGTEELTDRVMEAGALGRSTATRTRDLITRVFARRYLADDGRPARVLNALQDRVSLSTLKQFMLVYTARQHDILHDFITEVYWPKYGAGADEIGRSAVLVNNRLLLDFGLETSTPLRYPLDADPEAESAAVARGA